LRKNIIKKEKNIVGKDPYHCPAWYRCIKEKPKCYQKKCVLSSESYVENIMREKSFEDFKKEFANFKGEIAEKGNAFLESAVRLQIPAKEAEKINKKIDKYNKSLRKPDEGDIVIIDLSKEKPYLSTWRSEEERLQYVKFLITKGIKPTKSLYDLMLRNSSMRYKADNFKIAEYFVKNTDMPKTIPYYFFDAYYTVSKYSNFKTMSTSEDQIAEKKK
jgi:hypothetical protein